MKQVLVSEDGAASATFTIGASLPRDQEEALINFLRLTRMYSLGNPNTWLGPKGDT